MKINYAFFMRIFKLVGISAALITIIASAFLLGACARHVVNVSSLSSASFSDYQDQTLKQIRERRHFQLADKEAELLWNSPREWRPSDISGRPEKGILFVHGLGDSPWSFNDIAPVLSAKGFLVRTILLPGHGTNPHDLLTTTAEQWQKIVHEQAMALEKDIDGKVYLGGFSTGANLVLEHAYAHPEIAGLVLFSPGFKSTSFDWLAPLIASVSPWLIDPESASHMQTPVRYLNVPTKGFAQFYRTSIAARRLLELPYNKPVFMVVAQHDSVLNTEYLLDVFQRRFTHSQSRMVWYGKAPEGLTDSKRILIQNDTLPELRISQFSHMGILFSPQNPLYGSGGSLRLCVNGQSEQIVRACERGPESLIWYSDWGYREKGRIHARLTFNPYFDWQNSVLIETLGD